MVRIITDSTSDLPKHLADELAITIVPLYVHFGSRTYRDGIDITTEEFYQKLEQSQALPTTSSPSPGDFIEVYDKLAEEADEILAITISSKLSATYEVAVEASRLRKSKARLEILDTQSAIAGMGLIAIYAAKAAQSGAGLDEVIGLVRSAMQRVDFRMAFDILEYLKRGGRIGTAQAFLGSMLKFHPVLTIRNGATEAVTRLRSRAKVLDYLCDFAMSFPEVEEIAVEDATTPDDVNVLLERLSSRFPPDSIIRAKVSPVIGTNVGPGVLGIAILPRE